MLGAWTNEGHPCARTDIAKSATASSTSGDGSDANLAWKRAKLRNRRGTGRTTNATENASERIVRDATKRTERNTWRPRRSAGRNITKKIARGYWKKLEGAIYLMREGATTGSHFSSNNAGRSGVWTYFSHSAVLSASDVGTRTYVRFRSTTLMEVGINTCGRSLAILLTSSTLRTTLRSFKCYAPTATT